MSDKFVAVAYKLLGTFDKFLQLISKLKFEKFFDYSKKTIIKYWEMFLKILNKTFHPWQPHMDKMGVGEPVSARFEGPVVKSSSLYGEE